MEKMVHNKDNLQVYIVDKESDKFLIGRTLTKNIYQDKFKTTNIKDNYDLGIVMFYNFLPIFNINITIYNKKLPFLLFFKINNDIKIDSTSFELSGLSILENECKNSKYLVFFMLHIINEYIIEEYHLKTMFSIQHDYLINKFHNYGYGNFFKEIENYTIISDSLPNDSYWSQSKKPKIYTSSFGKNINFLKNIENHLMNIHLI